MKKTNRPLEIRSIPYEDQTFCD